MTNVNNPNTLAAALERRREGQSTRGVRGLDLTADDDAVRDLLETARAAYEKKKEGSRTSAAKRRAEKKATTKAALEARNALEAAPAVEPLP